MLNGKDITSEHAKFDISQSDLDSFYAEKYGSKPDLGRIPKLRKRFNYYTPEDYYELAVKKLVTPGCSWAEVGCGRFIFPSNFDLANELSNKAGFLFGVDSDDNIKDNPHLSDSFQGFIEDVKTDRKFDLITLRMVAEHIAEPEQALDGIDSIAKPGTHVVIYTPGKWALMSILARLTPMSVHHYFKKILWNAQERDTFPVQFKMNTRKKLDNLFVSRGYEESYFSHLDDCRIFTRFYAVYHLELTFRQILNKLNITHPENCILAIYKKK